MVSVGFKYDTSVEEPWGDLDDGHDYWPWTLDHAPPSGFGMQINAWPSFPGFWELPVYAGRIADTNQFQTMFDFNLWATADLEPPDFVKTLKNFLHARLDGNRAPMLFGAHTDEYSAFNAGFDSESNTPNSTWDSRRAAIEEFLDYALLIPQVRIVSYNDVRKWMENPVPLGGICTPNCAGRVCGSDGCTGSCGGCDTGQTCDAQGQCVGGAGSNEIINATFSTSADGFAYIDDAFRNTNRPAYASGRYIAAGGFQGGGLRVDLGGVDTQVISGMSGGWRKDFTLSEPADLTLTFHYNLTQTPDYESDEFSQVLVSLDGTLIGRNGNDYVARIVGNGNGGSQISTGFVKVTLALGRVNAGTHTLRLGGFNNQKTYTNESTTVILDNVLLTKAAVGPGCTQNSECNDANPCTTDSCLNGACQHTNNNASCADDGNSCTNDVCGGGVCTHPNNTAPCADDGNSCTNDVCSGGVCTHPSNGSCGGTGGGGAGGNCSKPAWSSGIAYQKDDVVVEDCAVSIAGTACYQKTGNSYAWRCDAPTWCSLEPGSNSNGWWSAWTQLEQCN